MKTVRMILLVFLAAVLFVALLVGALFAWTWATEQRYEAVIHDVIDPQAAAYIAQTYPGNDFIVESAYYAFKDNSYVVSVRSQSSEDTRFSIRYDYQTYEFLSDSYVSNVTGGTNTRARLLETYQQRVTDALQTLPGLRSTFVDFCRFSQQESVGLHFTPAGLDSATLTVDQPYDETLGSRYGYLELNILTDAQSCNLQTATELLLEADRLLTESGVGYYVLEINLEDAPWPDTTTEFTLYSVRSEDLHCPDPLARLQQMWNEQEARRQEIKAGYED